MSKFKVGDKVIAINNTDCETYFNIGDKGVVTKIHGYKDELLNIKWDNKSPMGSTWFYYRFKKNNKITNWRDRIK